MPRDWAGTIQFWRSGDWTMVYKDGLLVRAGDHYLADEWLQAEVGVTVVDDDAGVCIPDGHNALQTLDEVVAANEAYEDRITEATTKRQQAAELVAEAEALEARK